MPRRPAVSTTRRLLLSLDREDRAGLAREHGYKVETAEIERVAERLEGQDPQRAKTVSAINEANRELWAAAASPGVAPAARAGYLQAIARNEERLLRIAGPEGERTGPARYVAVARKDRCAARGRGKDAGLFCDEPPAPGRTRCRIHGGASPVVAARAYPLSGARCRCGKVTSMSKGRMRCRNAQQHAACEQPSVSAVVLEREFGAWLTMATTLRDQDRARIAKLVRAHMLHGADAGKAARLGVAIKRLTDAFTWGALEEDDYRSQLADLRAQLGRVEQLPEERRILVAPKMAADFASTWQEASPEVQRRITWTICSRILIDRGTFTEVDVRKDVAPLFAVAVFRFDAAVPTGFEPAISSLTGTYARPLHHGTVAEIRGSSARTPLRASILSPMPPETERGGECASFHSPPLPVWPTSRGLARQCRLVAHGSGHLGRDAARPRQSREREVESRLP